MNAHAPHQLRIEILTGSRSEVRAIQRLYHARAARHGLVKLRIFGDFPPDTLREIEGIARGQPQESVLTRME